MLAAAVRPPLRTAESDGVPDFGRPHLHRADVARHSIHRRSIKRRREEAEG